MSARAGFGGTAVRRPTCYVAGQPHVPEHTGYSVVAGRTPVAEA